MGLTLFISMNRAIESILDVISNILLFQYTTFPGYNKGPEPISFDQFAFVRSFNSVIWNICKRIYHCIHNAFMWKQMQKPNDATFEHLLNAFFFKRMRIKHLIHHKSYSFRFSHSRGKKKTGTRSICRTEGAAVKQTNRFLISLHISLLLALYFFVCVCVHPLHASAHVLHKIP